MYIWHTDFFFYDDESPIHSAIGIRRYSGQKYVSPDKTCKRRKFVYKGQKIVCNMLHYCYAYRSLASPDWVHSV